MDDKWYGVYEDMSETAGEECFYLIAKFRIKYDALLWMNVKAKSALFPLALFQIDDKAGQTVRI